MPTIDSTRGVLVIRIVYDGPALSGKTSSLRALASGVGGQLATPEERDGRTLFFDWVDYVGGLFEGRQIRCQIVSVPGQRELASRRNLLLRDADAVVCVLDTRESELSYSLEWLAGLLPACRSQTPPVGIVVQANKRDSADAVDKELLRQRVNAVAPVAIVESVATGSDGIRESFVLAVRLALDRVRALSAEGKLPMAAPTIDQPEQLLDLLRAAEVGSMSSAQRAAPVDPRRGVPEPLRISSVPPAPRDADDENPFVPDPLMPGGMIWPPVDGRALLHEVARLDIHPARTPRGDWWASASGFRFHSSPDALFVDHEKARDALIAWARMHTACAQQLSAGRVVILADAGRGRLRLWQIVRVEALLREQLAGVMAGESADELSTGLLDVAARLCAARDWFEHATARLPCTLWTVSTTGSYRPSFAGLMPDADVKAPPEPKDRALLMRELMPHLRDIRRARVDYREVCRRITARADRAPADSAARHLADVVATSE